MTSTNQPPNWGYPPSPWAYPPPPPVRPPHRPRAGRALVAIAGGLAVVVAAGVAVNAATQSTTSGSGTPSAFGPRQPAPTRQQATAPGYATAAQQVGIVDINTMLGYQGGEAAGTGMIITSSGDVLTNNHVVDGATQLRVTVVSTGATYTASVVGTDPTADVAVIHLQDAHGLKTVRTSTARLATGQSVTGVGNAGGVGGTPSAAPGTVLATDQTITASDENGANAETLHGLIETNAPIQAGDSGGPLYNSGNAVVGMDTAASSGGRFNAASDGYAIPIGTALSVARQIENGQASSTVHLGLPAFLGVEVTNSGLGATVAGVVPGGPAQNAGITPGDVITAVGGHQVTSASGLSSVLRTYKPGQQVKVTYTGGTGQQQTATVTLATGPAD